MDNSKTRLLEKLASGDAQVAVIGLGYVGLPLAVVFAESGYKVIGIDLDPNKVNAINCGQSYIDDVSQRSVQELVCQHRLSATSDFSAIAQCDAISICVPTPLRKTGDPDISYIVSVTEQLAKYLLPGMVVVLESTTYPGTTMEVVLPLLSKSTHRLKVGENFFLAFSPERVDPGRRDWTTRTTPKVIGGVTPDCLEVSRAYYGRAIDTLVPVSSTEAAEMVKLLENTYRAVNIGLVNEVLLMCDRLGLDVWEVIDAAATKPFGFMKFTPGPGLGGHCIPIDPLYLSWKLRTLNYTARFIELASEVNTSMPRYWARKVQDTLNESGKPLKGSKVLVLGVAYKKDVGDVRESPALDIIHELTQKGAILKYHDPHVALLNHDGLQMTGVTDLHEALYEADCVVVVTDHSTYEWEDIRKKAPLLIDTRRAIPPPVRKTPQPQAVPQE
ncbi:MAG: nucleotide sugar dehydrogenase [Verrucomicrobia bacterium]|nr:nucleotide sugar dehydrogenase [Verrucomicrobiota bacterium]